MRPRESLLLEEIEEHEEDKGEGSQANCQPISHACKRVPYSKWMMMLETRINTNTDSFGFTNVMILKAYL
jgi:hypothetical protein